MICLSETWLRSSDKLHLPGYCIIHRDCCNDSKGGGFAIYHTDELSVKRRIDLEHENLYTTDCPWSLHSQSITLLSIQCINTPPPKLANQKFLASLSEAIDICLDSKLESILMGNLNFNQLPDKDSTHGLVIICQSYHTDQLNHTLTRTGLCLSYIHTHIHETCWVDLVPPASAEEHESEQG